MFIFAVAIITGVVVNFYTQTVEMQQKETLTVFMDKPERLPELSKRGAGKHFRKSP